MGGSLPSAWPFWPMGGGAVADMPLVEESHLMPVAARVLKGAAQAYLEAFQKNLDPAAFANGLEVAIHDAVQECVKLGKFVKEAQEKGELYDRLDVHETCVAQVGAIAISALCLIPIYQGRVDDERKMREETRVN